MHHPTTLQLLSLIIGPLLVFMSLGAVIMCTAMYVTESWACYTILGTLTHNQPISMFTSTNLEEVAPSELSSAWSTMSNNQAWHVTHTHTVQHQAKLIHWAHDWMQWLIQQTFNCWASWRDWLTPSAICAEVTALSEPLSHLTCADLMGPDLVRFRYAAEDGSAIGPTMEPLEGTCPLWAAVAWTAQALLGPVLLPSCLLGAWQATLSLQVLVVASLLEPFGCNAASTCTDAPGCACEGLLGWWMLASVSEVAAMFSATSNTLWSLVVALALLALTGLPNNVLNPGLCVPWFGVDDAGLAAASAPVITFLTFACLVSVLSESPPLLSSSSAAGPLKLGSGLSWSVVLHASYCYDMHKYYTCKCHIPAHIPPHHTHDL